MVVDVTSLCCPMRKSDEIIIGKPHPTLLNILISNTVARVSNTQVNSRIHSRNIRSSRFGELKNSFLYLFETRITVYYVSEIEFQSRRISNTESTFTSKHSFDIEWTKTTTDLKIHPFAISKPHQLIRHICPTYETGGTRTIRVSTIPEDRQHQHDRHQYDQQIHQYVAVFSSKNLQLWPLVVTIVFHFLMF